MCEFAKQGEHGEEGSTDFSVKKNTGERISYFNK
jgi:hypothetical protein